MRFSESNNSKIRLHINDLSFKAYLEDSDITYETKDQALPFTPTSFTNDSIAVRVTEKAKFTFNVFSETRKECLENYKNLETLISRIKPSYRYVAEQLTIEETNVTGFVNIEFRGLPIRNYVKLHLTSFNYSLNKELGYIQVPTKDIASLDENKFSFYDPAGMKLIPLAYKITLEGKVLLEFDKTAHVLNKKDRGEGYIDLEKIITPILGTSGVNNGYREKILALAQKMAVDLLKFEDEKDLTKFIQLSKELADKYLVDPETLQLLDKKLLPPSGVPGNPWPSVSEKARVAEYNKITSQLKDLLIKQQNSRK